MHKHAQPLVRCEKIQQLFELCTSAQLLDAVGADYEDEKFFTRR